MSHRITRAAAVATAIVAGVLHASTARGQQELSITAPLPSFAADTFTLTYAGDLVGLLPTQVASDTATDPFALAGGSPSVNVVFNSGPDTTSVIFSGNAIGPGTSVTTGPVTFGINEGSGLNTGYTLLGATWSSSMEVGGVPAPELIPAPKMDLNFGLPIMPPPPPAPPPEFDFGILSLEFDGRVYEYVQDPLDEDGGLILLNVSDTLPSSVTITSAGYYLSPTQIPLDDLNPNAFPPAGSLFIPLPSLDGVTLAPGQSLSLAVPEPASLASLAIGCLAAGIVACVRRSRKGRRCAA